MNVLAMMRVVLRVADAMIRKPALPDIALAPQFRAEGMRVSALDELDRAFDGYVVRRGKQQVHMLGHDDECVQLKAPFAAITVQSFEKKPDVRFHDEQPATLPGQKRHEISSGQGDESHWLQERTPAAGSRDALKPNAARVKLV